jgi:hypothetical protein
VRSFEAVIDPALPQVLNGVVASDFRGVRGQHLRCIGIEGCDGGGVAGLERLDELGIDLFNGLAHVIGRRRQRKTKHTDHRQGNGLKHGFYSYNFG